MDDVKRCSKYDNEKESSEFKFRKETKKHRNFEIKVEIVLN